MHEMQSFDPAQQSLPTPADFDTWKDTYREEVDKVVAFSGQDADFFTGLKARALLDLTRRRVGEPSGLDVLDVGCGVGVTDHYLVGKFGSVTGVDISEGILERAARANPGVDYRLYGGDELPLDDASIDVAFAVCVVHHVPPTQWVHFVAEMARVLRPGGLAAIFEHNPHNPLTRRVVSNCVFDDDAVLLRRRTATSLLREAGLTPVEHRYLAFLPVRGRRAEALDGALRRIPLGAQYYAAAVR
jgi:SAM-dependent methyltransferase